MPPWQVGQLSEHVWTGIYTGKRGAKYRLVAHSVDWTDPERPRVQDDGDV